jgi:hypothetical protein
MARRSLLETALTNYLAGYGWDAPSLRVQAAAFPGVTPSHTAKGGKGRGSVVIDVERVDDSTGIVLSYVAGIKASADRKSTVTITTGKPEHVDAVVTAGENGLSIPVIVVAANSTIQGKGEDAEIIDHGPISVCVVNVGDMIRQHGVTQRTQGQGKGRGSAAPVAWGVKRQRAASGKVYEYVSLQVNLPKCGATWHTLETLPDLADFIAAHSEGIPV